MNGIDSLLEQLHDIEGLDSVSWWPLAVGWWMVIVFSVLVLCVAAWWIFRWFSFRCSWKYDTLLKLSGLEQSLSASSAHETTIRETVILFSEYLRRIAMRRFARSECAGLVGEDWLLWLSRHDGKNFDWAEKGKLLIQAPYEPVAAMNQSAALEQMKDLIQAAKEWGALDDPFLFAMVCFAFALADFCPAASSCR